MRPLILLMEADEAETDNPGEAGNADKVVKDASAKPEKDVADETPEEDTKSDDEEDADSDPAGDDTDDDDMDDESDDSGDSDTATSEAPKESANSIADKLRRERLYDAILTVQSQAEHLRDATNTLADRIDDEANKTLAVNARGIVVEVISQCETIRRYFSDLGYDRVRELYTTVRERVSAVAEIIKHVIDGDDDFRKPDSGDLGNKPRATK